MFTEGLIIIMDLDKFENYTREHGFDEYKPNIITGTLTSLVEEFVRKWRACIVYGLDYERGTEEAIIEIPYGYENAEEIINDLSKIKDTINRLGARITIVVIKDYILCKPAHNRREAYHGTPGRRRATQLLRKYKRKGGNTLVSII